jgi:hypothetical protein
MIQNISTPQRTVPRDPDLRLVLRKNIESAVLRAFGIANVAQVSGYAYVNDLTRAPDATQKVERRPDLQRLARDAGAIVCAVLHRHTTADSDSTVVGVANNIHGSQKLLEFVNIYLLH